VGDDIEIPGGLDMGTATEVKPYGLDDSKEISQESCNEVTKPTILDFDDDILSIEYESFSCGVDVNVSLDVDLSDEYESFSFDPIQADLLFEYYKSEIVESNNVFIKNFDLNQTLMIFNITGLVNFAPTIFPRLLIHVDRIPRPMTSILARAEYIHLFSDWAQLFDKLKRALACALLPWWMYSFWIELCTFHCFYIIESWASLFDKLLCASMSFDLSSTFQLNLEWMKLQRPLAMWISKGVA